MNTNKWEKYVESFALKDNINIPPEQDISRISEMVGFSRISAKSENGSNPGFATLLIFRRYIVNH